MPDHLDHGLAVHDLKQPLQRLFEDRALKQLATELMLAARQESLPRGQLRSEDRDVRSAQRMVPEVSGKCSHCRRDQRNLVAAALREVFNAEDRDQAHERVTHVIARLEPIAPKVCRLLEEAEEDLIAFYAFPSEHWTKLRQTNPLERVNKEIGRRSDVIGIFPNDAAVIRLAGALLSEQNDEWLVQRRYLSAESMTLILAALRSEQSSLESQQHKEVATLNAA